MPAPGTHRLFIAVDPPRELAEALAAWARDQRHSAQGLRVTAAGSIHLTLAFLGQRPAGDVALIAGAMSAAARGGRINGLAVGDPLLLPPRRPRVLAAAVTEQNSELSELRENLAEELSAAIGWSEERAFRPHLTLARMGREARAPRELSPLPTARFDAAELVLYRSHLEPSGARYEAIERVALN